MSPGWLPSWPRPMRARHLFTYRRGRRPRRPVSDRTASGARSELPVAFGTAELPLATVHSVRGALHHWATVRWSWVRPRAVPALVALMALVGLLALTNHLSGLAANGDPIATAPVIVQISPAP